jgi:hypothetical protein
MLVRQLRDMYWARVDPKSLAYPTWRIGKLKKLTSRFDKNALEKLIYEMGKIDIESKTSRGELSKSLDFLMAKYLE